MTDSDNGTDLLRQKAENGDAASQFLLGKAYDQGEGIEQNFEKATEWYLKATKQGNVDAQFNLAVSYENGQGVKRNLDTAVSWYLKAAEQGDTEAQERVQKLSVLSKSHDSKKPFISDDYKDILWPKNKKRKGYRVAFYITLPIALFFL